MKVIAIAAVGKNGVIGKDDLTGKGALPWDIPEDMNFFRQSTKEQIVLMGRKTYQSMGRPLPKRKNIVLTRDSAWNAPGVDVFSDIKKAIDDCKKDVTLQDKTLFIIGGAEIYELSLPYLDEVWLTEIDSEFPGTVFFPHYQNGKFEFLGFKRIKSKPQQDTTSPYHYLFVKYGREK